MDVEVFYGPWRIDVVAVDTHPIGIHPFVFQRFVISGSDNADGTHSWLFEPLSVSGTRWQLTMEWQIADFEIHPTRIARSATYDVHRGLRVILAGKNERGGSAEDFTDLILACESENPALDPLRPSGNPYDFSIPKDAIVR